MKVLSLFHRQALLLLASMFIVPFSLVAFEQKSTEIHLSEVELEEIFNNPKRSYVYVGKEASDIAEVIDAISKLDDNKESSVWGLKNHIERGFVIGNYDGVAQALEQAELVLRTQEGKLEADAAQALSQSLDNIIEQVIEEKLNLDADSLSYLKDSVKSCCGGSDKPKHCHGLRLLVIKEKIDVLGKAKFREDVTFYDDVTFRDDVKFKDDVRIEGTLSSADAIIGCDLTVGCNISMNDSISADVGNVIKNGVPFIHNFGVNNTFMGVNAGNFTTTGIDNTAFGYNALLSVSTGSTNIAIGSGAGSALTTGSGNIYIDANAAIPAEATTTRIGTSQTRNFQAGIRGVTTGVADAIAVLIDSAGQLGTMSSSRRLKHDIADMGADSASIYKLHPVTFAYNSDASETKQYGLIAEEVDQVFPGIVVKDADGQPETVQYHVLPALLLNEVQKHQAWMEDLSERVARLEKSAPAA